MAVTSACGFSRATVLGLTCAPANSPATLGPLLLSLGVNDGLFTLTPQLRTHLCCINGEIFCCSVAFLCSPITVLPPKSLACTLSHIHKQLCSFMSCRKIFFLLFNFHLHKVVSVTAGPCKSAGPDSPPAPTCWRSVHTVFLQCLVNESPINVNPDFSRLFHKVTANFLPFYLWLAPNLNGKRDFPPKNKKQKKKKKKSFNKSHISTTTSFLESPVLLCVPNCNWPCRHKAGGNGFFHQSPVMFPVCQQWPN